MKLNLLLKIAILISTLAVNAGEYYILKRGIPLNDNYKIIAKQIKIKHPEKVKILLVNRLPKMAGITFRYGIIIKKNYFSKEILIHELTHVKQYEQFGSIKLFLTNYFYEIYKFGNYNAQLEIEAQKNAELF